ncbi:MAG: hypothetical protein V9E87_09030 [Gemmatimonadales bacterium]
MSTIPAPVGPTMPGPDGGWRLPRTTRSLPESHHSVNVPEGAPWWRKALAFAGPGLPGRRRLHGSGQLGHRPRRRRTLRLHAAAA